MSSPGKEAERITFEELLEAYLGDFRKRGGTRSGVKMKRQRLSGWVAFCHRLGIEHPGQVELVHLAAYRRELAGERANRNRRIDEDTRLSPHTVYGYLEVVRTWFRWAAREGHLVVDPARYLKLPRRPRLFYFVPSPERLEQLMEAPSPETPRGRRDRALLELFYGTGVRRTECHRLDLDDLELPRRRLRIRRGKGRRDRWQPVGEQLAEVLEQYLDQGRPLLESPKSPPALFLSIRGARLSAYRISNLVRVYAATVGLKVAAHALRHAFATHLLEGGAGLREVQALLGHRRVESTVSYTNLMELDLREEYRRTHPRARRNTPRRP